MDQLEPGSEGQTVTLLVKDASLTCDRQKLAQCSPYFNAMFNSGMLESKQQVIELKVSLVNIESNIN